MDEKFMETGGHKAFKPMEVITCSDGTTFPNTGMGGQAAAQHEHSLTYVRPKAPARLALTLGDWQYLLTKDQFVVSKTNRFPGGSCTWYPLHVGWTKSAPKGRHFRIRLAPSKEVSGDPRTRVR